MAHVTVAIKLDDLGYDTSGDNRGAANQFYDSLGVLLGKNVDRTETGDGYLYGSVHDLSEEAAAAIENMVALISLFSESPPILTECQAPSISVSPPDRQSSDALHSRRNDNEVQLRRQAASRRIAHTGFEGSRFGSGV